MSTRPKAVLLFQAKRLFSDGCILQMRITSVPGPVPGSTHSLKYQLFYGRRDQRLVLYDNERGKGDHRHYGDCEEPYPFTSAAQLVQDFLADVRHLRPRSDAATKTGEAG